MATTINYPLTKTVVSAEGSAEVIAYGSNDYTAKWSVNTDSDWSLWGTFPTVVRVGNYVWCWRETTTNHTWYVLIDIVEDVDNEFGGNLAYPEITNTATDSIANVLDRNSATISISTLTDGPYRPLAIGNKVIYSPTGIFPGFRTTARSIDQFTPVLNTGTIGSFHIGCNNANVSNIPVVRGWGNRATKKGTNGDTRYGLFAPFATQQQFETLYGKEHNWQTPTSGKVWLFEAESGSGLGVYSGSLTYPFTVAAMVPNTKYRDVPGDTTGDGIDNTPSFEAALAGYAVASVTKCDGFPEDLIPGLDMEAINKKLNEAKAGIESAIASTGLLDLEKKLEGLKADIIDKFPKATEVLNFIEALADLDLNNLAKDAIDKLKEEWKFIDNIDKFVDGIIDDIANFDICSTIGLKGKTADDGSLVNKPESPSIPDKAIDEPTQSSYVPEQSKETAQTAPAAAAGITQRDLEDAKKEYEDKWKQLSEDKQFSWGKPMQGYGGENPSFAPKTDPIGDIEGVANLPASGIANEGTIVSPIPTQDGIPLPPTLGGTPPGPTVTDIVGDVTLPPYVQGVTDERFLPPVVIPLPKAPEDSIEVETIPGTNLPKDITKDAESAIDELLFENQPVFKSGAEWEKRLREIKTTETYQKYQRLLNEKEDPIDNISTKARKKLIQDLSQVLVPVYNYRYFKERLTFFKTKLKNSIVVDGRRGEYFPTTDYDIAVNWSADLEEFNVAQPGSPLGFEGVLDGLPVAVMTQENFDELSKVDGEFVAALKKYFFTDEGVRLQQKIMAGQNPPFGEDIQNKLLDALGPEDSEGDPVNDNASPVREYDPSLKKQDPDKLPQGGQGTGTGVLPAIEDVDVSLSSSTTTTSTSTALSVGGAAGNRVTNISKAQGAKRFGPVQPRLLNILQRSAEELDYTVEIFSGGQVPKARGGINGINRWSNTKRHDDGFAVDIYTYNKDGRKLRVKSDPNHRDTLAIRDFVKILLQNGITSVGAHHTYMNGDLHLDIANSNGGVAPKACWGKGPLGSKRIYAPFWLSSIFDTTVT